MCDAYEYGGQAVFGCHGSAVLGILLHCGVGVEGAAVMGRKKTTPQSPMATAPLTRGARTIAVEHPVHGTYLAKGIKDRLQAVQLAAKAWGMQWSKIARECEFWETTPQSAGADSSPDKGSQDREVKRA